MEATLAVVAALSVGGLAALALAAALGPGPGRWAWALMVAGGLYGTVAAVRVGVLPRRRRRDTTALAREAEASLRAVRPERDPDAGGAAADGDALRDVIVSAVQATERMTEHLAGRGSLGFSPLLARRVASQAADRLEHGGTDAVVALANHRARRTSRLALVGALCLALSTWLAPEVLREGARALLAAPPAVASAAGPEARVVELVAGDLSLRLELPAYLGQAPREVRGSDGDFAAVAGTRVELTGALVGEASQAADVMLELESDPGGRWPLRVEAPSVSAPDGAVTAARRSARRGLVAELVVGTSDRYRFLARTPSGELLQERHWRRIEATEDAPPSVRLMSPDEDLEVHAGDEVTLVFEATDDHGLGEVTLVTTPLGRGEATRSVAASPAGERTTRGSYVIEVAALGLAPGEQLEIVVEASDTNAVSGPGVGRSGRRILTMYSPEAEHDALVDGVEALVERMVDVIADRLESPLDVAPPTLVPERIGDYVGHQQGIVAATEGVLEGLGALVGGASTDPLATDALRQALAVHLDALEEVQVQERSLIERSVLRPSRTRTPTVLVTMLQATNTEGIGALESAIFELQDALEAARAERLMAQGRQLMDAQQELVDLVRQLQADGGDDARSQALQKIAQLAETLDRMKQQLAKLAEQVPYDNQNSSDPSKTDNELDMGELASELDQIRDLIEQGRLDEALAMLEEVGQRTQELMAALQEGLQPQLAKGGATPDAATQAMAELGQELDEVTDAQERVRQETGEVREAMERQALEAERDRVEEALGEAMKKAEAIEQGLGQCDGGALPDDDAESLETLKGSAKSLKDALDGGDVREAIAEAERLMSGAPALGDEVGRSEERELDRERSEKMQDAMERLGQAGQDADQLAQDLRELVEEAGEDAPPPNAQQRREMKRLGQSQGQLEEGLDEVEQALEQLERGAPGSKGAIQPMLEGARESMQAAEKALGERQPAEAERRQQEALERLGSAREEVSRRTSSQKQDGGAGVGTSSPLKKVAIPQAEDAESIDAYRRELMRGMRDQAPESFEGAVRRYYEELVK